MSWQLEGRLRAVLIILIINLGVMGLVAVGMAGRAAATTPYGGLAEPANRKPALPKRVSLIINERTVSLTPSQLGWKLDGRRIDEAAGRKGLPVRNGLALKPIGQRYYEGPGFFEKQVIPAYATIDESVLERRIAKLAATTRKAPVNARITTRQGEYVISPATDGRQIDVKGAVVSVRSALEQGRTVINLPSVKVSPKVTAASLRPSLQRMKARQATLAAAKPAAPVVSAAPTSCAQNSAGRQLILVSISRQHLWACDGTSSVYDTAITSGAYLAGNATPAGTWYIYAKTTNIHLVGPTWDDPVSYWMPFYSDYGFHDSSWQTFAYGSAQYASQGSHGCVHVPLPAMAWLYGWAPVGTAVTITG